MAKVIITSELEDEINRKFKGDSVNVFKLMYSLAEHPNKGKFLGDVGKVSIKEIRYKGFRLYFLVYGFRIKFLGADELNELILKFVRMSDKKEQQKTIEEIKKVLRLIGEEGF